MFSKCLSHELIGDGIRVNCVNPGLILTPAWRRGAESLARNEGLTVEQYFDRIAKEYTPIGRFATPEELAHFFVFLCSERASYCVGSTYYVDGGWLNVTT
jgi:NAD(P)-dependent dehydrogenase (short-subunit alcohol dehydrogenase family)